MTLTAEQENAAMQRGAGVRELLGALAETDVPISVTFQAALKGSGLELALPSVRTHLHGRLRSFSGGHDNTLEPERTRPIRSVGVRCHSCSLPGRAHFQRWTLLLEQQGASSPLPIEPAVARLLLALLNEAPGSALRVQRALNHEGAYRQMKQGTLRMHSDEKIFRRSRAQRELSFLQATRTEAGLTLDRWHLTVGGVRRGLRRNQLPDTLKDDLARRTTEVETLGEMLELTGEGLR